MVSLRTGLAAGAISRRGSELRAEGIAAADQGLRTRQVDLQERAANTEQDQIAREGFRQAAMDIAQNILSTADSGLNSDQLRIGAAKAVQINVEKLAEQVQVYNENNNGSLNPNEFGLIITNMIAQFQTPDEIAAAQGRAAGVGKVSEAQTIKGVTPLVASELSEVGDFTPPVGAGPQDTFVDVLNDAGEVTAKRNTRTNEIISVGGQTAPQPGAGRTTPIIINQARIRELESQQAATDDVALQDSIQVEIDALRATDAPAGRDGRTSFQRDLDAAGISPEDQQPLLEEFALARVSDPQATPSSILAGILTTSIEGGAEALSENQKQTLAILGNLGTVARLRLGLPAMGEMDQTGLTDQQSLAVDKAEIDVGSGASTREDAWAFLESFGISPDEARRLIP